MGINVFDFHLPNRWAAVKAGLGKFGQNNFVYDPVNGSYIWIEVWVVDKELEYDSIPEDIYLSECGKKCNKCLESCPTGAISNGFSMNIKKCIEHIAWQKNDIPSKIEMKQMGLWICGCDACQDVCPYNKNKFVGTEEIPDLSQIEEYLKLDNILAMDEEMYLEKFYPRF
jgi:epoxyqueuosine reductase